YLWLQRSNFEKSKKKLIKKGLYSGISFENIIVETATKGPRSKQNRGKIIDFKRGLIKEESSKDEKEKSKSSSESYGSYSESSFNVDASKVHGKRGTS
ncbi:3879_t:CDS:2, partial [Rhizophagus irregularis]